MAPGDYVTVRPLLATEWSYLPDGKTIRFKLRDDIKFESGNRMTAEDVRFSFARLLTMKYQASQYLAHVDHVAVVDDHTVEVPPSEHMLVVRNDDRPGMIGVVGVILGEADVSISSMAVGPSRAANTALMVLSTDRSVPDDAFARLRAADGILDIHRITSV